MKLTKPETNSILLFLYYKCIYELDFVLRIWSNSLTKILLSTVILNLFLICVTNIIRAPVIYKLSFTISICVTSNGIAIVQRFVL